MIIPPFGVVPLAETQGEQNVAVRLVFEYLAETTPYVPADTPPIRVTVFIILTREIFSVTARHGRLLCPVRKLPLSVRFSFFSRVAPLPS
jgi:hypothetical protein